MKTLRNILALSGLLLMMASFVWMQLHQTKRVKSAATEQRSAAAFGCIRSVRSSHT